MTFPASPSFVLPPATPASSARPEKLRLGDVLVRQQLLTEAQLQQALAVQQQSGKKLGRVLVDSGVLTEELLADGLARQLRIPCINLKTYPFRPELVRVLPEAMARRLRVLLLEERSDGLLVGMSDPLDLLAFDEITRTLKRSIHIAVVPESQLLSAFDRLYRRTEEISGLARALEKDIGDAVDFGELTASAGVEGAPVVRLLQSLFEDAAQAGASDVHIEPQESNLQIRLRVDGVLQTQTHADKRIGAPLAQRIKLMAGLDNVCLNFWLNAYRCDSAGSLHAKWSRPNNTANACDATLCPSDCCLRAIGSSRFIRPLSSHPGQSPARHAGKPATGPATLACGFA